MEKILKKYCENLGKNIYRFSNDNIEYTCLYLCYYKFAEYVGVFIKVEVEFEMQEVDDVELFKITSDDKLQSFFDCL